MKCQNCFKAATLHITEVLAEQSFEELHLCEECAQKYLSEPADKPEPTSRDSSAELMGIGEAEEIPEETTDLSQQKCDVCGMKFVEFRNSGRLGCPHDYQAFQAELIPLLESIHGQTRHSGKTPRRLPRKKATQQEISRLRKDLLQSVNKEDYEAAARIRDQIRRLEELTTS